jgi:hypothetical protein
MDSAPMSFHSVQGRQQELMEEINELLRLALDTAYRIWLLAGLAIAVRAAGSMGSTAVAIATKCCPTVFAAVDNLAIVGQCSSAELTICHD